MKNKTNDPNTQSVTVNTQDSINTPMEPNRDAWYSSVNDSGIYCDEYEITDNLINETH